jgi:imidazolonepropionase-like amidohydrolase
VTDVHRIEASLLIPGRGDPVVEGVVVLDGATITYAGPAADAPADDAAEVSRAAVVMPGLWDCHAHIFGLRTMDFSVIATEPLAVRGARCVGDMQAALDAGVTSVREVGGLGVYLARVVNEGTVAGPSIYGAGSVLSTTGGHGDIHAIPLPWIADLNSHGEVRLADGPADCAKAVREQLRRGARVIKICASGGVLSEIDHPIHQQFTVSELQAIVEVAGLAERVVAAHCHGKPGMMAALEAGVRTIEHGTYLDEEVCAAMKETGAILVPTRTIIEELLASGAAPDWAMAKLRAMADTHAASMALAHEQGVTIAAGTDIALSGRELPNSWGRNGRELPLLVRAGLTPLQAIEAATATGPLTLGPQAPQSGQLVAGYAADVITLDADPVADISVLADPDHVIGVWQGGRSVKTAAVR